MNYKGLIFTLAAITIGALSIIYLTKIEHKSDYENRRINFHKECHLKTTNPFQCKLIWQSNRDNNKFWSN